MVGGDSCPVTVVDVRGASKRYGDAVALSRIDLAIGLGEVHGLVGPNGAGKTTLLRILLGLVTPDEGTATVLGAPAAPARDGVAGFVEAPRFYPHLTGRRNLELLRLLDGAPARDGVDTALERVGLHRRADTKVSGWSTGMRQRLGVAAALLRAPRLLVLDEPTSGMDPVGVADLHALVRELAATGTAVLLSSHDMLDVAALCSGVTVLGGGRVRFSGTTAALRDTLPPPVHLLRTSDDDVAERVARATGRRTVLRTEDGLRVTTDDTDALVLALARQGVAVRTLVEESDPLTRAFLELTA